MQLTHHSSPSTHASTAGASFLSQLLAAAGEAIVATDLHGVVQYWNRAAEQLYGWSAAEATGRPIHQLTVPELSADTGREIMEHVLSGQTWEGEFTVRRHDGSEFLAHVVDSPIIDERGDVVGVVGVSRDITERRQAREEMRRSERRWRSLSEATPALVCETDARGHATYCNPRFQRYTGLDLETLVARRWRSVIHPDDFEHVRELRRESGRTQRPFSGELRLRSATGGYRWHLAFAEPRVRDGETEGWVWAAVDVHDQRLTEERLRAANAAKDEFLGLVSHELKTPITMIVGNAELLARRRGLLSEDDVGSALEDIHTEANELTEIIENMLVLARLDDGARIETEPLRVERTVTDAISRHHGRHSSRRVDLHADPALPLAEASPVYVQQIVGNLLSNAEKYSPPATTIDVQVRAHDGTIETTIADRGPGVANDELETIFRPFYRSKQTRGAPGVGIGLAVCRRLAEAQRGTLTMHARDGGGLVATLSLPAIEE